MSKILLIGMSSLYFLIGSLQANMIAGFDFNQLPSLQGWSFVQSGPHADELETEASMFSVTGGVLQQRTVGVGQGVSSCLLYTSDAADD